VKGADLAAVAAKVEEAVRKAAVAVQGAVAVRRVAAAEAAEVAQVVRVAAAGKVAAEAAVRVVPVVRVVRVAAVEAAAVRVVLAEVAVARAVAARRVVAVGDKVAADSVVVADKVVVVVRAVVAGAVVVAAKVAGSGNPRLPVNGNAPELVRARGHFHELEPGASFWPGNRNGILGQVSCLQRRRRCPIPPHPKPGGASPAWRSSEWPPLGVVRDASSRNTLSCIRDFKWESGSRLRL
jgi:hypothetical protein